MQQPFLALSHTDKYRHLRRLNRRRRVCWVIVQHLNGLVVEGEWALDAGILEVYVPERNATYEIPFDDIVSVRGTTRGGP